MSTAPARRPQRAEPRPRPSRSSPAPAKAGGSTRSRAASRRRRERHFARRRQDLLQDAGVALLVAIILLSVTAGLGIVLLLAIPTACFLIGCGVAERRRRGRRP